MAEPKHTFGVSELMMYFFDCASVIKRTADIAKRDAPRAVTANGAAAGAGVAVAMVFVVGVRVLPLVWFLKELHGVVVVVVVVIVVVVVVEAARAAAIAAADPGGGVPGTPLPVR
jgi:high-affinity Fe2+/Pb2+ permease